MEYPMEPRMTIKNLFNRKYSIHIYNKTFEQQYYILMPAIFLQALSTLLELF